MSPLWNALAGLLLAYALLCAAAFVLQRSMIYFPSAGQPVGEISLKTDAGGPVLASSRIVPGSPDAIVYFGGNAEDVSAAVPEFAAEFPSHSVYALHYRGYGGSAGSPSEPALRSDALALVDRVRASQASRLVIVGRSLGSSLAVHVATQRPDAVSRLVLITPFDSLVEVAAHHYPILPVRWLLRDRYESWREAPRVSAPVLLIVAEQDEIVPAARAARLRDAFRPGVVHRVVTVPGADHNNLSYAAALQSFLRDQ